MLEQARALSIASGDIEQALAAARKIDELFRIASLSLRLETLESARKVVKTRSASLDLADAYLDLCREAVRADDYEIAKTAARSATTAAKRSGDRSRRSAADAQRNRIQAIASEFRKLRPQAEILAKDPSDADANAAIGRFVYAIKREPALAIGYLERASNDLLRRIGQEEKSPPEAARDQAQLGDLIWSAGEQESGLALAGFRARAADWYIRAFSELPRDGQERVKKRIAEALDESPAWIGDALVVLTFDRRTMIETGGRASYRDLGPRANTIRVEGKNPLRPMRGIAGESHPCGGKDDSIVIPTLRDHIGDSPTAVTVGLWARSQWKPGFHCLFDMGNCATRSLTVGSSGTDFRFIVSGQHIEKPQETVPKWHHIVCTWNAERLRLYVDGKLAIESAAPGLAARSPVFSEEAARLGGQAKDYERAGRFFSGLLDEFFVLPRALDDAEVREVYARGLCGMPLLTK